jgi:hypothetical protein
VLRRSERGGRKEEDRNGEEVKVRKAGKPAIERQMAAGEGDSREGGRERGREGGREGGREREREVPERT